MQLNSKLKEQIAQAVRISMRIEGHDLVRSREVKAQAKVLMERQRVQVSIRSK
jgi:hypothetical protein